MSPNPSNGDSHGANYSRLEIGLLTLVLLLAVGLRGYDLSARPMHADEANQAVKLGQLIETGEYRFDPHDHHGPTLYYFGQIPAWLRGQTTLATLTESTVRLTPAIAGVLSVALLWALVRPWGRWPALLSALLLSVSPPAVYYSRYFIQETLLVAFTLGAMVAAQRWWRVGGSKWAVVAGGWVGLMLATKASAGLFVAAALLALVVSRPASRSWQQLAIAACIAGFTALFISALFYSSLGRHPGGLGDALLTIPAMFGRVTTGESGHEKPWWYYGSLFLYQRKGGLVWDQSIFILTALVGGAVSLRGVGRPRFLAVFVLVMAILLSVAPYKTPWLIAGLLPGMCALAAWGLARLKGFVAAPLVLVLLLSLIWQTRQAVFQRAADPRNPLAYVHTSPDLKKVPAIANRAPAGVVKVIGPEYWPLPWYLRGRAETGFWTKPPADCDGVLVLVDATQADEVRSRLRGHYRESFLGYVPACCFWYSSGRRISPARRPGQCQAMIRRVK